MRRSLLPTLPYALVAAALLCGAVWATRGKETAMDEERDRREILAHIDSIFRAYLAADRATIRRLHTDDWVGFQGPSTAIERGLDAYMRNAEASLQHFEGTGYELLDTELRLHGDLALVYYLARYDYRDAAGAPGSLRLRSLDVYCREADGWNQCGSHITPVPSGGGRWGE
jgi:ketosteroid isomerase-like protein